MRFDDILMAASARGGGWTPASLGSSLLAWWDAEATASLTLAGSAVTTWTDLVGGYALTQATTDAKPTYSATSFNGLPGVTADAADDELTCTDSGLLTQLGSDASYEIWAAASQDALAADATTRFLVNIGDGSANTSRSINRLVSGGVNRARALVGSGAGSTGATQTTTDFSGRHVLRAQSSATDVIMSVGGVASSTASVVPSTTATRLRIFANSGALAASFYQGVLSALLITRPLSAGQAAQMSNYLGRRV